MRRLDEVARAPVDEPPPLLDALRSRTDTQWLVIDCLGLPLSGGVQTALWELLPGWRVERTGNGQGPLRSPPNRLGDHLEKLDARGEPLSFSICLAENIKLLTDAVLSSQGRFPEDKWSGRELLVCAPLIWQELVDLAAERDSAHALVKNRALRRHFAGLLERYFTRDELRAWDSCNLHRLRFQLP